MRPTIVISAYNVAGFPEGGGHFWVYLQYVLALRQLGCEVYWLEDFRAHNRLAPSDVAVLRERMRRYGLGEKWILYRAQASKQPGEAPRDYASISRDEAEAIFERADLLINFHYAISPGLLARFRRTALVDIDPGLLQFWISRAQLSVARHDVYFTTGETVGEPGSRIPDCGLHWIHIRPAVCLAWWPYRFNPACEVFTTVSQWDSSDWVVDHQERYENTKRVAFLEFIDLPRLTGPQPLELALFLCTARDLLERTELQCRGWRVRHSREAAGTPDLYQSYIQGSRGEFSCAKPSCARFQNAWVSDRTLCYLASGKPVVVQDTGASSFLPNGRGMFRFSTPEQAARAFTAINEDYEGHCLAAREIVETHFDATQVAGEILQIALR